MLESDFIKKSPEIPGILHHNINLLISCSMFPEYPLPGDLQLPIGGTGLYLMGITIPTTWEGNVDLSATLKDLTTLRLPIEGKYINIPITARQRRIEENSTNTYYFLRTAKTYLGTTLPSTHEEVLTNTGVYTYQYFTENSDPIFTPYLPESFGSNNYNSLINNFTKAITSKTRQVVDNLSRYAFSSLPGNFLAIINQSAQPAEIQDSNYSKLGTAGGRYRGSTTDDNGILGNDPALRLQSFRGSIYSENADNIAILVDTAPVIETIYYNVNTPPILTYFTGTYDFVSSTFPSSTGMLYLISGSYQVGGNLLFKDKGNLLTRITNAKVMAIDNSVIFSTDLQGHIINQSNAN